MSKRLKVIYYKDEIKDEFAGDHIIARKIDGTYQYERNTILGRFSHIFWYRIIAIPLAWLYMKLYFHHRIMNKKVLQKVKGQPYFMYGNHTHPVADALVPTMVNMPKNVGVIVHPNNVSMPVLGKITPSLGALPLPDDFTAAKNFMRTIENRIKKKQCIMIYPEAHIWPYYTKIRPFVDISFRYPVKLQVPVFALTNTYQRRRFSKRPKMVTYIDGPFVSDLNLSTNEQKKQLRDLVYEKMTERAKNNNIVMIRYEKNTQSE